jgi:acetyl esterase/lipase
MITWQIEEYMSYFSLSAKIVKARCVNKNRIADRISFGNERHQYALYFPPNELQKEENELIIHIPGGGWRMGSPDEFSFMGWHFADQGYHVILPGYRLAPKFSFPCQIEDVSNGIIESLRHLSDKGISFSNIIIGGQSAGAQLAALLADGLIENLIGLHIKKIYFISGPLDFNKCKGRSVLKLIADYIPIVEDQKQGNPINHIAGLKGKDILLIHGEKDPLISISNSESFCSGLMADCCELLRIKNAHHSDLVGMFLGSFPDVAQRLHTWMQM